MADEQSLGIEPDYVSGFSDAGSLYLTQDWNTYMTAELAVYVSLSLPIALAGAHQDHAIVRHERGIVGVDSIKRQLGRRRKVHDLGSRGRKLSTELFVLRLRFVAGRCVMESQLSPSASAIWIVPACEARRAHQYPL